MRYLRTATIGLLLCLAATGGLHPLVGQSVRGRVQEVQTRAPIIAVDLLILGQNGEHMARTTTDSTGAFLLEWERPGQVRLRASRLGFKESTTDFFVVREGETVTARVLMSATAVPVDPLIISSRVIDGDIAGNLADFQRRRQLGIGHFLDREQIRSSGATLISQVLTRIPGITMKPMPNNPSGIEVFTNYQAGLISGRSLGSGSQRTGRERASASGLGAPETGPCPMQVFLNGNIFRYSHSGVNVLSAQDIEAIEVYRGVAEVPAEFSGTHARCGVIALWTTRR